MPKIIHGACPITSAAKRKEITMDSCDIVMISSVSIPHKLGCPRTKKIFLILPETTFQLLDAPTFMIVTN